MENEHFPGIGEIRDFQLPSKQCFSNKAGHSNANKASYRKVSVYTKSMKRYLKERERRRQVRLLAEAGHTQKQIAARLSILRSREASRRHPEHLLRSAHHALTA